jgi:hypothetical protein
VGIVAGADYGTPGAAAIVGHGAGIAEGARGRMLNDAKCEVTGD